MCNQCTEVRFASFQSGGFNSGSNKSTGIKTSKSHLYAVPKSSSKLLLANLTKKNQFTEVRCKSFQSGGFNSGSNKCTRLETRKSHLSAVPKSSSKLLLSKSY